MPAVSKKQRKMMGIAEHHPEMLHKKNRGVMQMSPKQMHEFAATPEHGLPARAKMSKSRRAMRDRSTAASPPMTTPEIARGYRKLG